MKRKKGEQKVLTNNKIYGANIPPIRALIEAAPKPAFLITVGNCSTLKTYTVPYADVIANFPIIARVMVNHFVSKKNYCINVIGKVNFLAWMVIVKYLSAQKQSI